MVPTTQFWATPCLPPRTTPRQLNRSHRCAARLHRPVVFYHSAGAGRLLRAVRSFQTGYISTGLLAEDIFHTGENGIFGIDQAAFAPIHLSGLFIGASLLAPLADKLGRRHTFMFALAW